MPTPILQPGDLYVERTLSNISVEFQNKPDAYIADRVFPNVPVQDQAGLYWEAPRGQFFRTDMPRRAPGAKAEEISWSTVLKSYLCDIDAIRISTPDEHRGSRTEWDIDRTNTKRLTENAMLHREKVWAETFFTTGKWGTDITGVSSSPSAGETLQWNETGSDPIDFVQGQVIDMHEETGLEPNVLVITPHVRKALLNHPLVLDRVKYTQQATPMTAMAALASLLTVDRIEVAKAVINTANEVDDENPATGDPGMHFALGKHALLCYAAPNPAKEEPSAGYCFSWNGMYGASARGLRIKKMRNEERAIDIHQVDMAFQYKVISQDLGRFFSGIVA